MSFEIARSGINAVNGSLEAISNNIANAGTYGFKSSRANFSAMVAGTQAIGAEVSSSTQSMAKGGGLLSTGRGMDAMIQGRGFFAVRDSAGQQVYTRVGIFSADKDGYVVDSLGRRAQGYAAVLDAAGKPVPGAGLGALGDLKVPTGQIGAEASKKLAFSGNLSADWKVPGAPGPLPAFDPTDPKTFNSSITSVLYDSLGAKHSVTQYFVKTAANAVDVHYSFDGAAPTGPQALSFDVNGQLTAPLAPVPYGAAPAGAAALAITIDYSGTTQFAGDTTTLGNAADGYAAGTLTGTSLAEDGSVLATYSNGLKQTVGTVALATFANEDALKAISDTSWEANGATGTALFSRPGSATASKLSTGAVEQSNVDMTGELVNLMSAQRNYQANTKVISAENEMMQTLMQAI
ncbi:flagellar hook-basal body complex protein [Paucibacter sediminis]|uniref:Flagellar hook protein FlgE n=1 Tax=Paucibacter sediminis TaxID=3019553 RepID=A0AA95NI69_9BURK|nr:flagellar hook-basal body complex protein [Paucibacter sp. S2-9]WIT11386.1 flagellar hook-basal body complex protein [Paucibacter sp. S2-9]